jgi:hypothetical protein
MVIRAATSAAVVLLCAASSLLASTPREGLSVAEILVGYNASIARAMAEIESLRVEQEMVEPTDEGGEKRATAVLTYRLGDGMERDELSSDIGHPVGDYSLESLVGPEILPLEYDVVLEGVEDMGGRPCYRLALTATERDSRHFDGTVWVDADGLGLVRITGEVADAPFPVQRIWLDKEFEPVSEGFRLLRRHATEIDIRFAFITKHGVAHIEYTNYSVRTVAAK